MSLQSLCDKDSITIEQSTTIVGESGGVTESYAGAAQASKRCLVQEVGTSIGLGLSARSSDTDIMLFFTADPGIILSTRIKWGERYFMPTVPTYSEGRPGRMLLWVAEGKEVSANAEAFEPAPVDDEEVVEEESP